MRTTDLDYVQRVNRAIDYIVANLEHPLDLDTIARQAYFSPFHFHRIFRSLIGETIHQFVKRLRLERAVALLGHGKEQSLTAIAVACGFTSSSDFSRSFKQRYGVPPSVFDGQAVADRGRAKLESHISYRLERLPPGENPDGFEVRLRELPPRCVAYIRVIDSFREGAVPAAAARLVAWAEERGLAGGQWLGYMWDNPDVVALKDCRYDVGLVVPDVEPDGEIGRYDFPAMRVAEVEVRGPIELEMRAIDWIFGTWLPSSRFVPADLPCFEAWIGRPFAHEGNHFEIHAHVPVERR